MARPLSKDLTRYLLLALGVWSATQAVTYWVQLDSVDKTLDAQLMVYHQQGESAYRSAVRANLVTMGLTIDDDDLVTRESRPEDEFQAELHYRWPLHVLVFTFDRPNVARARTILLDG